MEESPGEPSTSPSKGKGQNATTASSHSQPSSDPIPVPNMDTNTQASELQPDMSFSSMDAGLVNTFDVDSQRPSDMANTADMSHSFPWAMDMPDPQTWSTTSAAPPPPILGLPLPTRPMVGGRSSPSIASETSMQFPPVLSPEASFAAPVWPVAGSWVGPGGTSSTQDADEELERTNHENSFLWNAGHSPSYSQLLLARSIGRTPRLRYLISYYAEVIAPMVVAFDSPTNPFRTHILRLAQGSEALQEAIATLATSNLRQRRERFYMSTERTGAARMSSMAHRALTDEAFQDRYGISVPEGYAREENYHRRMAVKALNADLADPRRRLSDSVLATLLVLCLFHSCDTGVAEFRTQFAGVTRLLAIRMRHSPVVTDDLKWFIRMFSWFDTLTATTNDRDVQLRGKCLEISSVSDGEWGLENLAGCDGRLFKMISQLGRLNLLSQDQRPTEPRPADVTFATAALPPNMQLPSWDTMTGPGLVPGGFAFSMPTPPQSGAQNRKPSSPAFWTEWYSLRQRLESWRFDPPSGPPFEASLSTQPPSASTFDFNTSPFVAPPSPTPTYYVANENLRDVYQISECFRHAALLYCERLAEPSLPSQHPRIQHLVRLGMHCLCTAQSDVYLLWPLFIVGSECVQEDHRATIRDRCKDISKDSGFVNNMSCLELLEKIWEQHTDEFSYPQYPPGLGFPLDVGGAPASTQAFRWSRVMQAKRGDGEYMVA